MNTQTRHCLDAADALSCAPVNDDLPGAANPLTEGSLLRGLLRLAGPMAISALLQNAQTLIDLFWVGRIGSHAVAGVAVGGTIQMLLAPLVFGMTAGSVAVVARRVGARDFAGAEAAAMQSLVMAAGVGFVCGAIGLVAAPSLCHLLGTPADAMGPALEYLRVVMPGSITFFLLFLGNTILQASGNTVIPMRALMTANALNIVLAPMLMFGWRGLPELGVTGAAIATVIAQTVACAMTLGALRRGVSGVRVPMWGWRWQSDQARLIARIGLPSSGQMLARSLMMMVLMGVVAGCGTMAVAGYGIGMRYHMIVLMSAFVLGNAAGTMVGQNLGAGRPERARRVAWVAAGIESVVMLVTAGVLAAAAAPLIRVFDDAPGVVAIGASYLRTVSFFYVFVGLAIVLGRCLEGAGETVIPMLFTVVTLWGLQVPLALWLSRVLVPAHMGVWWAIAAAFTMHGVLVTGWFATGRWQRKKV